MAKLSTTAIIALATTGIFLTIVTAGLIGTQTISSNGTLTTVNVAVYSDNPCTQNCTSINWGTLHPGTTNTTLLYVKNTGSLPITLSMTTESWAPTNADNYLTATWDQEGTVLQADEQVTATLTLTAEPDNGGFTDFSFNIIIAGAE